MRRLFPLLVLSLLAVIAGVFIALRPAAEEVDLSDRPKVSDHDLQTYIGVYSAMQSDHELTIERALEPYQMSLDAFRSIERQVQSDQRLTDKARQALRVQAQSRSAYSVLPTPTGEATEATPDRPE